MNNLKELAETGISYIEKAILTILSDAKENGIDFISQVKITEQLGIKDNWKCSHWVTNSIINKLQDEELIKPQYKQHGSKQVRSGFRITDAGSDYLKNLDIEDEVH